MQINISSKLSLSGGCLKQFGPAVAACDIIPALLGSAYFTVWGATNKSHPMTVASISNLQSCVILVKCFFIFSLPTPRNDHDSRPLRSVGSYFLLFINSEGALRQLFIWRFGVGSEITDSPERPDASRQIAIAAVGADLFSSGKWVQNLINSFSLVSSGGE